MMYVSLCLQFALLLSTTQIKVKFLLHSGIAYIHIKGKVPSSYAQRLHLYQVKVLH